MRRVRGVLIDLSGTVHVDEHAIAGSVEAVRKLLALGATGAGPQVRFVTNTSKESAHSLRARLVRLGVLDEAETPPPSSSLIFSSLTAARAPAGEISAASAAPL